MDLPAFGDAMRPRERLWGVKRESPWHWQHLAKCVELSMLLVEGSADALSIALEQVGQAAVVIGHQPSVRNSPDVTAVDRLTEK
jgi:hypothetical protein